MSARSVMACFWAVMAGLMLVVIALPGSMLYAWSGLGILAAGAIAAGVMRHRPRTIWPWGLLAAAILCSTAADGIYTTVERGAPESLLVIANGLYGIWLVCAGAALHRLARPGGVLGDRTGLIDAVTVTLAALLLVWVILISPVGSELSEINNQALLSYPIADVLLLGTIVRLLTGRRYTPVVAYLAGGVVAELGADLVHGIAARGGGWPAEASANLGWLLLYAAWGAAGLHPSMARLTEPEMLPEREITTRRLSVLVVTSLTAPGIIVVEALNGGVRDGLAVGLIGGVIVLLNIATLTAAVNADRRSLVYRENHDTLTGLANRTLFAGRLAETARRYDHGPGPAVLLIDLDEFKLVNDTMGHSLGDEVLVAVARRLARSLGRHDLAARLGSDEFAVLITVTGADGAEHMAKKIMAAIAEPVPFGSRSIRLTASVGIATAQDALLDGVLAGSWDPHGDLLSQAGLALQASRAAGLQGQWSRYRSELHGVMVERMRLRTALAQAVAEGSFMLQYQPIVAIDTGIALGFEALIRWEHPTRGLVAPSEFIELAEETGLIEPIGDWVLRRAVTAAAHWHRTMPYRPYVSVNVSALQFRSPGFAEKVGRELASAGLPASDLMIELTESVLFREGGHVWAELQMLRDNGVRLAIDDFGTGFSSLRYLLQTPIDVIKVDRSFVGTLSTSTRHRTLVDGIVRLAKTLGLEVIAEGIETTADRDQLIEMGCRYGQGYLYSVPLASGEVPKWLAVTAGPAAPVPAPAEPSDAAAGGQSDGVRYAHSGATVPPTTTMPA